MRPDTAQEQGFAGAGRSRHRSRRAVGGREIGSEMLGGTVMRNSRGSLGFGNMAGMKGWAGRSQGWTGWMDRSFRIVEERRRTGCEGRSSVEMTVRVDRRMSRGIVVVVVVAVVAGSSLASRRDCGGIARSLGWVDRTGRNYVPSRCRGRVAVWIDLYRIDRLTSRTG